VRGLHRDVELVVGEIGEALVWRPAVAFLLEELKGVEVHAGMVDAAGPGVGDRTPGC
jgi:hypothetical protein